ncbi:MAG: hypothetical protein JO125_00190 [Chloroflexi bacterium]|nr:hypothetical protein [Ktedonobacteraceae bacterium]MBV9022120.1 hypothetical protein [Ktedonobacteraceae bacterium]MBV9705810.1 hypothetical protein [Chloroflexota bacterium]
MYIYYILRGIQNGKQVELEGDVNEEQFPDIDLDNGPTIVSFLIKKLQAEGTVGEWQQCDLTDSFFGREDDFIYFHDRWMRRSDAPWRKDKYN